MSKSPDAFRTISEVAEWLGTPAHVLRFWESKFPQIKPVKRAGGRRYYRPSDMLLLGGLKRVLHEDGMTIRGAQKLIREKGVKHISSLSQALTPGEEVDLELAAADVAEEIVEIVEAPAEPRGFAPPGLDLETERAPEPTPEPELVETVEIVEADAAPAEAVPFLRSRQADDEAPELPFGPGGPAEMDLPSAAPDPVEAEPTDAVPEPIITQVPLADLEGLRAAFASAADVPPEALQPLLDRLAALKTRMTGGSAGTPGA
ncbi:MAG: MerR family transcriptional regulator [Pseudomonadota bacterium]